MSTNIYPELTVIDQKIQQPPDRDFMTIEALLLNPVLDRYFFSKLARYDWLPALRRAKLLDSEAIDQSPHRLAYLQNLIAQHPLDVTGMLSEFQYTTVEARANFIAILTALPSDLRSVLLPKLEQFDVEEKPSGLAYQLEALTEQVLQREPYRGDAWYLTRFLLLPVSNVKDSYRPYRTRLDDWHYGHFLEEHRQHLEAQDWYPNLLVELLATFSALYVGSYDTTFGSENYGHLKDKEHLDAHSAHDALLQEALNYLPSLSQVSGRFSALWTELERYPYALIHRLRLLLLAEHPAPPESYVRSALVDRFAFTHYPEYRDAARAHFPRLSSDDQRLVWSWLTPERSLGRQTWWADESAEMQEYMRRRDYWRQLQRLQPHLPDALRTDWQELAAEFGESEKTGVQFYSMEGTRSSITRHDLAKMTVPEIATLVQGNPPSTGDPHFDHLRNRIEGLADVLGEDVAQRPFEYLSQVQTLKSLPPQFLQAVISTLRTVEDETLLPVPAILDLLHFVNERSKAQLVENGEHSRIWSWCVGWLVDLLEDTVMKSEAFQARLDGAADILAALTSALGNPDPLPDASVPNLASYGDVFNRSLNVTRGKAVRALLRFMGWMHEQQTEHQESAAVPLLAQAKEVLANHLFDGQERSGAVYAAVVPQLPWLLYTDEQYAAPLIEKLFDRSQADVSRPVWSTHLKWGRPYTRMLTLLRRQYAAYARDDLPSRSPVWDTAESTQEEFGRHLGLFYLRGDIRFGQQDRILELFLQHGQAKAVARSVWSLNQNLRHTKEEKSGYYALLKDWWDRVLTSATERPVEDGAVIRGAVTALLSNDELPLDWRLDQVEAVLEHLIDGRERYQVVHMLASQSEAVPEILVRSLTLLARLAQQGTDGMLAYQASQLLEQIRSRLESELTAPINDLVETLVSMGYVDAFRDFHR